MSSPPEREFYHEGGRRLARDVSPGPYVLVHPSARLTGADQAAIAGWAATLPGAAAPGGDRRHDDR